MIRRKLPEGWLLPVTALALMGGILLGMRQGQLIPCAAAAVLSLAAVLIPGRGRHPAVIAAALCVGSLLGWVSVNPALPQPETCLVQAVVCDEVEQRDDLQIHTTLCDVTLDGKAVHTRAYWSFYAESVPEGLVPGARVTFSAELYHPSGAVNPGGYDWRIALLQRGVTIGLYGNAELTVSSGGFSPEGSLAALRHRLREKLLACLGPQTGGYAAAMLLGDRRTVSSDDREAFRTLGIGHILSVSGFHVGILYAALAGLLALLRLPARRRWIAVGAVLGFYCLLTGGSASVIRASILCVLHSWAPVNKRRARGLPLLAASAIIQLVISPVQLLSAGFLLSYGALLGITVILPLLRRFAPGTRLGFPLLRRPLDRLWDALVISLSAQLGVLLPQLYFFQELPVLGILFNVALLGVASGLIALYWLCFITLWIPGLGGLIGSAAIRLTGLFLSGVRTAGSADWLLLWTKQAGLLTAAGWVLLLLALCLYLPLSGRKRLLLSLTASGLIAASLYPWPTQSTEYVQLSVGNADCAVLNDRGFVCVIDTGEDEYTASAWLHQRRLTVDALILTHLHSDHAGGLRGLLDENIPVRVCYLSPLADQGDYNPEMLEMVQELEERGTQIVRIARGDEIRLPSGQLTVLWPVTNAGSRAIRDANNVSLCMQLKLRGVTMLLTGDLSGTYEMYAAVPCDILKAAHHGSATSSSEGFLQAAGAKVTLLSTGRDTREESFRKRITAGEVYSTRSQGALTVRIGDDGYTVSGWLQ